MGLERRPANRKKHVVVGENGGLEMNMFGAEPSEELCHRTLAEEINMLIRNQHLQKPIFRLNQSLVACPFFEARGLYQQRTLRLEQFQTVAHRCHRVRKMLQHIHQDNGIQAGGGHIEGFDRTSAYRYAKRFLPKGDHPRAHLDAGSLIACLPHQGDKAAVGAAKLQHARRRQTVLEQHFEPMQVAFSQVVSGAGVDVRKAEILLLMIKPILLSVKIMLIVIDQQFSAR